MPLPPLSEFLVPSLDMPEFFADAELRDMSAPGSEIRREREAGSEAPTV